MIAAYPEPFRRSGKIYYFNYRDKTGSRRLKSTGTTVKKEAREYIKGFLDDMHSEYTDITLRHYSRDFFTNQCPHMLRLGRQFSPSYLKKSRSLLIGYIWNDDIADRRMRDIRRGDIIDWLNRTRGKLGDKHNTIDKALKVLKTVFTEAEFREDVDGNPAHRVTANYTSQERHSLTLDEIRSLFKVQPGVWEDEIGYWVFYIAASTGMRSGEIRALSWKQIDMEAGIIDIDQAWKDSKTLGLPKWDKVRKIPVSNNVIKILTTIRDLSGDEDLLFRTSRGYLRETWWKKHFDRAIRESGINAGERNITPHSLRHTLNSLLLESGIDNWLVQQYLGWTSRDGMSPVQRGYSHIPVQRLKTVSRKIGQLF